MGFVANFIRFLAVQNFENRLRLHKVTESLKVGTFSETQCISVGLGLYVPVPIEN